MKWGCHFVTLRKDIPHMLFLEGKHVPALQTQTMKNFAAIDFETANQCHSSVCSVGVVVVRDG